MKKLILLTFTTCLASFSIAQNNIEWTSETELKLDDFKSPQTEINPELKSYSIYSGANIDFSYRMSNYEFMFTKNFNSRVKTIFNVSGAVIIAIDSAMAERLVKVGQYDFDLSELYARKLRKRIFEEKKAFSNPNFFQPLFTEIMDERNAESARVMKATDLGQNEGLLQIEHQKVLSELEVLADFCQSCKPPKRAK